MKENTNLSTNVDQLFEFQAKSSRSAIFDNEKSELLPCKDGERIIMYVTEEPDLSIDQSKRSWKGVDLIGREIILSLNDFSKVPFKANSKRFLQTKLLLSTNVKK